MVVVFFRWQRPQKSINVEAGAWVLYKFNPSIFLDGCFFGRTRAQDQDVCHLYHTGDTHVDLDSKEVLMTSVSGLLCHPLHTYWTLEGGRSSISRTVGQAANQRHSAITSEMRRRTRVHIAKHTGSGEQQERGEPKPSSWPPRTQHTHHDTQWSCNLRI